MKKILFAIVLALGTCVLFCSCQKEGASGSIGDTLVGSWILDEEANHVREYCEFTNDGMMKVYVIKPGNAYATYDKGVLYTPASNKWELYESVPYSISGGIFSCKYFNGMEFKVVNKNTIQINEYDDGEILDNYLFRIKTFSTK